MTRDFERLSGELSEPRVRTLPARRVLAVLGRLDRAAGRDPASLIRLHERLLFLAAYPPSAVVRSRAVRLLEGFRARIADLSARGDDLRDFDEPEVAGVVETELATQFSYDALRWLASRYPSRVRIAWELFDEPDRLGAALPRFLPLLEEEALADASVPYRSWIAASAGGRANELPWLLERFERWNAPPRQKAEVFDSLGLPFAWNLRGSGPSRTRLIGSAKGAYYHPAPLLSRRDVSLPRELATGPLPVRRLDRTRGERALDLARETTALRYRELYGFTYGDPGNARVARVGRGVEIFVFGLLPERRLPLRAGYNALVVKNGVPIGYFEGLALFERMEAGFNVYYTFREGESGWIYATLLKLCRQLWGASAFSIDPYQIGFDNAEAIESGAFWFYRKLGFEPTSPNVARLLEREEARLARRPGSRTPPATLRRLATSHLIYDADSGRGARRQDGPSRGRSSPWSRFHIRNLGLAVGRRMAREFGGDPEAIRRASAQRVARTLGWAPADAHRVGAPAFEDLALVLDLVPDLARWSSEERSGVRAIVAAKMGRSEDGYLRLLRQHARLRDALIALGSRAP